MQNIYKATIKSEDKTINTLYVTDLDGTLLNDNAELTETSRTILQKLIDKGVNFTVATGRTLDNTIAVVKDLKFKLPIITDNGTFVYDTNQEKFLKQQTFNLEDIECIVEEAVKNDVFPFINTLDNNDIHVYYSTLYNESVKKYYGEKIDNDISDYVKDESYTMYKNETVFNLSMLDTYDRLVSVYEKFKDCDNINITLFSSHYFKGYWWLEVIPKLSGKGQALRYIKQRYKPEKIVCFGDNLNDLCMFELADYTITPINAVEEIKNIADEIIGHCSNDSVANYIENNFNS